MENEIYSVEKVLACVGLIHYLKSKGLFMEAFEEYRSEMKKKQTHVKMLYDGSVEVSEIEN